VPDRPPAPEYLIRLKAHPGGAPPGRRLARLLKACLWYGFTCVWCAELPADPKVDQAPATNSEDTR
jgi:hypothetical protein